MRDYSNNRFHEILDIIRNNENPVVNTNLTPSEFTEIQYFLVRNFYYPVMVDEYPHAITDKRSLLEALFYQGKLITVHDLNWDAIQEGLNDLVNTFSEFEGLVLLFKTGKDLQRIISNEMGTLSEIANEIDQGVRKRKITVLI